MVAGNGDRHEIRTTGLLARWTYPSAGQLVEAGCGTRNRDRHDVRHTDQERSTSNVQLSTFNEVTERVQGGRDMGTDTMFGRTAAQIEGQTRYLAWAAGFVTRAARCGDRHDVRYADQERSTSNVQLSTFNGVTEKSHGGPDMGTGTVLGHRRCK